MQFTAGLKTSLMMSLLFSGLTYAEGIAMDDATKQIKGHLRKLNISVDSLHHRKDIGLVEVVTERGLFYFSENGRYLIHGKIYSFDNSEVIDETELSLAQVRKASMAELRNNMLVFPAENEKYSVSIWMDTSCGYCRKLHSQISEYHELGITVRYLAFPRSGNTGPTAKELASIWCSDSPNENLTSAMGGDKISNDASGKCSNIVAQHYQAGMKAGVSGTPAIVLEDGSMIPGYIAPEDLLAKIETTSAN